MGLTTGAVYAMLDHLRDTKKRKNYRFNALKLKGRCGTLYLAG